MKSNMNLRDSTAGRKLSERQIKAVLYTKEEEKITNQQCQKLCGLKKTRATEDLSFMEQKNFLEKVGTRGPGVYYALKSTY